MSIEPPATLDAADGPSDRTPRLRFPKGARLFRAAEFSKVKAEGKTVHGRSMLLGVLKGQGNEPARIGIITSRRVGGAVARNRVRRRIREIVRESRGALESGLWMVVIAKSAAATAEFAALRAEWTQLARKAGCFRG